MPSSASLDNLKPKFSQGAISSVVLHSMDFTHIKLEKATKDPRDFS